MSVVEYTLKVKRTAKKKKKNLNHFSSVGIFYDYCMRGVIG